MRELTYRTAGDYLIPNIIIDGEDSDGNEEMIRRYGMMREVMYR